ncbi:hypothetical protein, partial [Escherichia coli]
ALNGDVYAHTQSKLSSPFTDAEMHLRFFTFGVLLRQPELGVSIRLAAKGDMEIVMFWPEVVVTVVAAMDVIIMVSIYWG